MTQIAASIDWHVEWHGEPGHPVLALVHGFAGSRRTWDELLPELTRRFHLLLVDLPGHGKTPIPDEADLDLERLGNALGQLIHTSAEGPAFLCGYSMGGRVALHTALFAPETVKAVALIGASPGIAQEHERERRLKSDLDLAKRIRAEGVYWFADYWADLPIFETQKLLPEEVRQRIHRARLECDAEGLAYCLEQFSTGAQECLVPRLRQVKRPLLLIAGQLDRKFSELNEQMQREAASPLVHRAEIVNAGHAAHLEQPLYVARELVAFFDHYES
jgi:2-succinyl-6-hydroxy-2,4-cyclohexadiene-1-carboxylate synthase